MCLLHSVYRGESGNEQFIMVRDSFVSWSFMPSGDDGDSNSGKRSLAAWSTSLSVSSSLALSPESAPEASGSALRVCVHQDRTVLLAFDGDGTSVRVALLCAQ